MIRLEVGQSLKVIVSQIGFCSLACCLVVFLDQPLAARALVSANIDDFKLGAFRFFGHLESCKGLTLYHVANQMEFRKRKTWRGKRRRDASEVQRKCDGDPIGISLGENPWSGFSWRMIPGPG